nr:hypothetical protein [Tanacetum cinerariifolium]
MLQICLKLPGQRFEDPSFEEKFLSFIRDLGHTREIKVLTDVNVNYMHQPWISFVAIINRCLSGKTTGSDCLRLSHYFMSKDQSISRRNKMFWHTARDDAMFNIIKVISRHQDTQIYGDILPDVLTNQEMLDSKAYKEYYVVASGAVPPKAKTKHQDTQIYGDILPDVLTNQEMLDSKAYKEYYVVASGAVPPKAKTKGGHSIVDPSCDVLILGALYSWEFILKFHLHACDLGS